MNNRCGYSNSPAARAHYPVRAYGVRSAASAAPGRLHLALTAATAAATKEAATAVVETRDQTWKRRILAEIDTLTQKGQSNDDSQDALKAANAEVAQYNDQGVSVDVKKYPTISREEYNKLVVKAASAKTKADLDAAALVVAQNNLRAVAAAVKAKNMPACPKVTSSRQNAEIAIGVSLGVLVLFFMVLFFMSRSKVKKLQHAGTGGVKSNSINKS